MNQDTSSRDLLRVSLHEHDVQDLMRHYPKLSRTEICDVISRTGPMRAEVERELARLSAGKT